MFTTIAHAQEGMAGGASTLMSFLPFILIIAIFYFLIIRPQQKRQKELNATISSLKSGDQIMTTSGFIGTIDSVMDANTYMVNLGNGVKVRIVRQGIAGRYDATAASTPSMQEKK